MSFSELYNVCMPWAVFTVGRAPLASGYTIEISLLRKVTPPTEAISAKVYILMT